jgi:hypothetical protein
VHFYRRFRKAKNLLATDEHGKTGMNLNSNKKFLDVLVLDHHPKLSASVCGQICLSGFPTGWYPDEVRPEKKKTFLATDERR